MFRETKFSGASGDREASMSSVQLTTSRIGNLTRLIHTLLYVMTIHTYIHTRLGRVNAYDSADNGVRSWLRGSLGLTRTPLSAACTW